MMPIPGSETYSSAIPVESLTKETTISDDAVPPDVVKGEDWPVQTPVITGLNPATAEVPGPDAWIVVHGQNFYLGSVINWNGQDVITEYVNPGKLRTLIEMTAVGKDPVLVKTGDLKSNVETFTFTAPEARKKEEPKRKQEEEHHKKRRG